MTNTRPTRDEGLTLAEMVVAIGIVMIVLIAALSAFVTAKKAQQTAEGTDRAIQTANSRIERIRQLDWADIGFYQDTYINATNGAVAMGDPKTTSDDYLATIPIVEGSPESPVGYLGTTDTSTVEANKIKPYEVTTETRNKFHVYTTITWGRNAALGLPYVTGPYYSTANPYSFKRVTVTIKWQSGGNGAWHKTTTETWFAPEGHDAAPPGVPVFVD